tara:strand:- start:111 stop:332 length:222 start_codon:yes stop_codon:yes gene_type:complete
MKTKHIEVQQVLDFLDKVKQHMVATPESSKETAGKASSQHDVALCWMMHNAAIDLACHAIEAASYDVEEEDNV